MNDPDRTPPEHSAPAFETITVRGAREHNLQDIQLELPKNHLICFTGVSGSGKSSLAFDTLYAEGQRRYVESLSAYARQFLGQMQKPDVDFIGGLSPTISIDQKSTGYNPRSTVATITEIYDYLRLLFARVGTMHCLECGTEVGAQTRDEIVDQLLALPEGQRLQLLAPVVRGRKGEYREELEDALKAGFARARVDGQLHELTETIHLDRQLRHDIEIVVDRIVIKDGIRDRIAESVETAVKLSGGLIIADTMDGEEMLFSQHYSCPTCATSYEEPSPQLFSFNSPKGACPECNGIGGTTQGSLDKVVPDPSKSIREGAIATWGELKEYNPVAEGIAAHLEFSLDTPWKDLTKKVREKLMDGLGDKRIPVTVYRDGKPRQRRWRFGGVLRNIEYRWRETSSDAVRRNYAKFMDTLECPDCEGTRLRREAHAVKVADRTIFDVTGMSVGDAQEFFEAIDLTPRQATIAEQVLKEVRARLWFLRNVGLHYLSLNRTAPTLSGGESQRIRLASQIGTGLVGVVYILDEPSIGLHARDNKKLLDTLKHLRDIGNTIIIVEHDEETMRESDYIVDFGPGAGIQGGEVVVAGAPGKVMDEDASITGRYLSHEMQIPIPDERRAPNGSWLSVKGARQNNLKGLDVEIPIGLFTCVTGVSGSGKSSLVNDIVCKALARDLMRAEEAPGAHDGIEGIEHLNKIITIDQSPIGRTPRSNPATYVKVWDQIRELYSQMPESRVRGYKPGRFSFNVKAGRCEACQGHGYKKIEMQLLADVWVKCEVCNGTRFNDETLDIRYKGKSIADALDMDISQALEHFGDIPKIARKLKTLHDVGLDYIKLGQPAPTLSGGEAQRVKLSKELSRVATGQTLYVLDEPTTGLHFEDVRKLLEVLHELADRGNTVVVIEHNMEVIKTADHIIDLGPEGGEEGGYLIGVGAPELIAETDSPDEEPATETGRFLRAALHAATGDGPEPLDDAPLPPRSKAMDTIRVRGATEHNLKSVDVDIPQRQMVAFTGVSGSGKTSLALDTIYAEGQRRYVESLSAYARQFLGRVEKPHVEHIEGLSPAIAIDQKAPSKSPRSTVGTVTEIYDYLRILYARAGTAHCPSCHEPVGSQTSQQVVDSIFQLPPESRLHVLAPVALVRGEEYEEQFERARKSGFARAWVNGEVRELDEKIELDRRIKHDVAIVADRLVLREDDRSRLAEAVEVALREGKGVVRVEGVHRDEDGEDQTLSASYSEHFACVPCGLSFKPVTPQNFSFNSSLGMCPRCEGIGRVTGADEKLVVPNPKRSIRTGAVVVWGPVTAKHPLAKFLAGLGREHGFSLSTPFAKISDEAKDVILYGSRKRYDFGDGRVRFRGAVGTTDWLHVRGAFTREVRPFLRQVDCPACHGTRLMPLALNVRIGERNIIDVTRMTIRDAFTFFRSVRLEGQRAEIARELLMEIGNRLEFLLDVGLEYLTMARPAPSLSGGEAQRIRLASQLGSGLTGVLYVLDEPTIGLHARDNDRLLKALARLRDLGNTVIVVEHDEATIRMADHVVDFGPRAGRHGGEIVAEGSADRLIEIDDSLTGRFLAGAEAIPRPPKRREGKGVALRLSGASLNNLKDVELAIPLGTFTAVTGVSGSGKSSLIEETLYPILARKLNAAQSRQAGPHTEVDGLQFLDKVINIDQKPIGETPRSNPATYTDVFTDIRKLFAELPEAKARGFDSRRFSSNLKSGQCETCYGHGFTRIEMQFLPDVWIECETCGGTGYNRETLDIRYAGKNVADVLHMTVAEALEHFMNVPRIRRKLETLRDVGLGYIHLGQSATTLSGGEAQRVKLAKELARRSTSGTIYLMDEPTTGLHFDDIRKLLDVIHRLADQGSTVVVIEHNLSVVASADHVIDLGPDGGEAGGYIVAEGTPE
ncbi:excinuclease ABC subunit UvrA, partial [Candidatus Poribacteria bacterium]|nr:excinuclease ABC subunit UvrA [Candidatus Poribacteria bacterium]